MTAPRAALMFCAAASLSFAACAQNQKVVTNTNANATVFSATPPFETQEPQSYQATRTTTTVNANGQTVTTTGLTARDGDMRREDSETHGQRLIYLTLPEGRFLLLPDEKLFCATPTEAANLSDEPSESSPDRLLHTEMVTSGYQNLGTENVGGRNLQKYRVVVNNSAGENVSVGETLLWFDEALHMPVKTETSSPNGTRFTAELSAVVLNVDKRLFEIPKDYQKVDFIKFGERLKANQP